MEGVRPRRPRRATGALDPACAGTAPRTPDAETSCRNRDDALAFIQRALADGVTAEPLDFRDAGDRIVVILQTHTPPEWGEQPEPHGEIVTVATAR